MNYDAALVNTDFPAYWKIRPATLGVLARLGRFQLYFPLPQVNVNEKLSWL